MTCSSTSAYTAQAQPASPSFFTFSGGPFVAATHVDGSYIGSTTLFPNLTTRETGRDHCARRQWFWAHLSARREWIGDTIGNLIAPPVIQIGGVEAMVTFASLVSTGEFQFNVVVPATTPDGNNTLMANYNGFTTQSNVLLAVQH